VSLIGGGQASSSLRLTNASGATTTTSWSVDPPAGLTVTPSQGTVTLASGASTTVPVTITSSGGAYGPQSLDFHLSTSAAGTSTANDALLDADVAYPSLADAFNNVGITDDSAPTVGNFDGSGDSYSAQALAAVGLTPGTTIDHDGASFTWPNVSSGTADNMQVDGQSVQISGSGSELAFLLAGTHGTATGTGTITYTDGTTQSFSLAADNWTVATAGSGQPATGSGGDDVLATTSHWNPTTSSSGDYEVGLYGQTVPLDPSRTVAYVTFPSTIGGGDGSGQQTMHIFGMAIVS
jgi:hypothetical protein